MHTTDLLGVYISPKCSIWPPLPSWQDFLKLEISSPTFLLQSSMACLRRSFQMTHQHNSSNSISLGGTHQHWGFENQTSPSFCLFESQSFRGQTRIPGSLKSCALTRILYQRDAFIFRCREAQSSQADNACRPQGVYYPLSLGYFRPLEKERWQQ